MTVCVLAAVAWAWLDRDTGLRGWYRLQGELSSSERRVAALQARIRHLEMQSAALGGDPFALERAVREELGLGRPGDIVVRIPEGSGTRPPGARRIGRRNPRNP